MNFYARTLSGLVCACLGVVAVAQGCSAGSEKNEFETTMSGPGGGGGSGGAGGTGGATTASTGDSGGFTVTVGSGGAGGNAGCVAGTPDDDFDKDGFTEKQGDCNDCDKGVNPEAVEVIAEPENGVSPPSVDEDCDGEKDNVLLPCDDGLVINSDDPMAAVKAIGLCKFVKSAKWTLADGNPPPVDPTKLANFHRGHGILDNLGPKNPPQEGKALLMLSSGTARKEGHPEYVHRNFDKGYVSNAPFGFPKESPSCPNVTTKAPHDATGLEIEIKAPSNAQGFSFDFNFFTFEWPQFICTNFNDFFVAIKTPFPQGQFDGNISYDPMGNAISVNNAFLDVCACPANVGPGCPAPPPPNNVKTFDCLLKGDTLIGTDFDVDDKFPGWTNGATGWLRTSAPVDPDATFTLRLVTYDSSDGFVDSSTLIDNWRWSAKPGSVLTEQVPK
jgi:hypothetical protein